MKYLKLLLIFVGIIGGIIIASNFEQWFINPDPDIDPDPRGPYRELQVKIQNSWDECNDWNENIFDENYYMIKARSNKYRGIDVLFDYNTTMAIDRVEAKIFDEWHNADCANSVINNYINAVKHICALDKLASQNARIVEIYNVYSIYNSAYKNANTRSFPINTGFNKTNMTWNSYSKYVGGIDAAISSILNNTYYTTHLANITNISYGLSRNVYRRKICGSNQYYNILANQIYEHFSKIPSDQRTRAQRDQLRSVNTRFSGEAGYEDSRIRNLTYQYAEDADANENNTEA